MVLVQVLVTDRNGQPKHVGMVKIVNDATGDSEVANYDVTLVLPKGGMHWRLEGYSRVRGVWALIGEALRGNFGTDSSTSTKAAEGDVHITPEFLVGADPRVVDFRDGLLWVDKTAFRFVGWDEQQRSFVARKVVDGSDDALTVSRIDSRDHDPRDDNSPGVW